MLYYASNVFQDAGLSGSSSAALASVGVAFVKLMMTGVSTALVDRAGRRILLLIGILCMAVALLTMALGFGIYPPDDDSDSSDASGDTLPTFVSIIVILAMMLYVSGYQIGFGPISWTMISEIFPVNVRSQALSLAVIVNFVSNVIVTVTYVPLQQLLTLAGAYVLYLVVAVLSILFVFFIVPETKNRSLEQIEELLVGPIVVVRKRKAFPFYW